MQSARLIVPRRLLCLLLFAVCGASVCSAEEAPAESNAEPAYEHVAVFAPDRPVFLRLAVLLDGRPIEDAWKQGTGEAFSYADVDGDGKLSAEELRRSDLDNAGENRAPSFVESLVAGFGLSPAKPAEPKADDAMLNQQQFHERLRKDRPPFRVVAPRRRRPQLELGLREWLDADADGAISGAELQQVEARLARLDLNGNELIETAEMLQYHNPLAIEGMMYDGYDGREPKQASALAETICDLSTELLVRQAATRLLREYGDLASGGRSVPLSRLKDAKRADDGERVVEQADANADGRLDVVELERLLRDPPIDVVFSIRLGKLAEGEQRVEVLRSGAGVEIVAAGADRLVLWAGGLRLECVVDAESETDAANTAKQLLSRFDSDSNGYLDEDEASRYNYYGKLTSSDRDGDGKIFEKELLEYVTRRLQATGSRVEIRPEDRGRELFRMLDANADERLSPRERRGAAELLARFDRGKDGALDADEVPQSYRLTLGKARPIDLLYLTGEIYQEQGSAPAPEKTGPAWFQKLDRNSDGDVSSREFPGPLDVFEKLDRDRDGLIDADEAKLAE